DERHQLSAAPPDRGARRRPRPAEVLGPSRSPARFETSGTIGVPTLSPPRRSMVIEKLGQIGEGRKKKQLPHTAEPLNAYAPGVGALADPELAGKTAEFRERLQAGETLDDLLPEAFASVREAARRTIGRRDLDGRGGGGGAR